MSKICSSPMPERIFFSPYSFSFRSLMFSSSIFFFFFQTKFIFKSSFYQLYNKLKDGKKFKSAMSKIMFYMYLIGSILFVFACSPSNVSQRNARNLIYILGLNFGKLVVHHIIILKNSLDSADKK